jgi:NADH:ubiquinone oxidoreductase subunit K
MKIVLTIPEVAIFTMLGLLGIGLYGLITQRNLIKMVVALQVLVKGSLLGLVIAGRLAGRTDLGQSMAMTFLVVDTIVAVITLALVVQIRKRFGTLDIKDLTTLRR